MQPSFADLETLLAVAEAPHLRAAAKTLGITQPALSVRLKRLQAAASFPLLITQGRRKVLHPRFQQFVRQLSQNRKSLMDSWNALTEAEVPASQLQLVLSGRIEIWDGLIQSLSFPGTLVVRGGESDRVVDEVLKGQVDIVISHVRPDSPDILARPVFDMEWELVVPKPWAKLPVSQALASRPAAFYKPGGGFSNDVREWLLAQAASAPRESLIIEDWRLVRDCVESARGWTVAPNSIKWDETIVKRVSIPGQSSRRFYAFIRKDRLKRTEIRALWEQVLKSEFR